MPPKPVKQHPSRKCFRSLIARAAPQNGTGRRHDECQKPEPAQLVVDPVAGPAAEARRALSQDETRDARSPSQPKQATCAADVANEATEVKSARLTPELSRAEGVGLNE